DGFGAGANGPLLLAAELPGRQDVRALPAVADRLREVPDVAFVAPPRVNPQGDAALLLVVPGSSPQARATEQLVHRLRDDVLPQVTRDSGVTFLVGGTTAAFIDQSEYVGGRLPWFIAAVVGLAFILLLVTFHAPVVALKAAIMNLLSVGA